MAGNPIDLVVTTDALKGLSDLIARLEAADKALLSTVDSAAKLNKAVGTITTPQGLNANSSDNAQVNAQLKAQADIVAKLNTEIQYLNSKLTKLNETKARGTKLTADEIVQNQELRKAAIAEAKANSDLIGSYQKLNIEHQKALKTAKDAGVTYGITSKEFQNASTKANQLGENLKKIDAKLGQHTRNVGNYSSAWNGLGNALGSLGIMTGVAGAVALGTSIFNTTKEIQSLDNALKQVTETEANYAQQQQFLTRIADSYGVELSSLTKQFTQFYVSAKDKISGSEIQKIFESITKAGATMGLSVEAQERAFLALNQMISKGVVSAEELRGQLGEALPGAFGIMAKALNVNEQQLATMMKQGKLLASEVLPLFAEQLEKTYGIENVKKVENLAGAQNRLTNSWKSFVKSLNESDTGGISVFFKLILDGVSEMIKGLTRLNSSWDELYKKASISGKEKGKSIFTQQFENLKGTGSDAEIAQTIKAVATRNRKILQEAYNKNEKDIQEFNPYALNFSGVSGKDLKRRKEELRRQLAEQDAIIKEANRKKLGIKDGPVKPPTIPPPIQETKPPKKEVKEKEKKVKKEKEFDEIADAQKSWEIFKKLQEDKEKLAIDVDEQISKAKFKKMEEDWEKEQAILKKKMEFMKSYVDEFVGKMGFTEAFKLFDGKDSLFARMQKGMAFTKESWKEDSVQMMEGFQEVFNFISNASQANFDAEYARLESQKDIAISFAGDSASAKKKIEEDFDKKKREIANREAKAKKKQAMFNIAIDTAQAAIGSLRIDPTGIMAIVISAMGALQLGLVAAQKIPQYWKGTDYAQSGLAWTNEKGAEIHTDKYGNIKSLGDNNGARLTMMEQGDKVYTASESQRMLQDKMLNDMLIDRGISMNYNSNNTGLTYAQMKEIMNETLGNKPEKNIIFDKNGFSTYIRKSGNITRYTNQRASGVGMTV